MKYIDCAITYTEVPGEVSLCFSISGCKNNCGGCHSPELQTDVGTHLTTTQVTKLLEKYSGFVTCVTFLGGDNEPAELARLLKQIKNLGVKTCLYSGQNAVPETITRNLDYIKLGDYRKDLGGLSEPTTNQYLMNLRTGEVIYGNGPPDTTTT